ncbi:MAG: DUF4197 domain-containing protein [Bacteroidota bacterium]
MKIRLLFALFVTTCLFTACTKEDLEKILSNPALSNEEIIAGLKSALNVGTDTSVSVLNKQDGYYKDLAVKVLLPPEAQAVYSNISKVPGGDVLLEETVIKLNRAAEDAAAEARPIFIDAITGITIEDGLGILNGDDTAATFYLKGKTFTPLTGAFQPKIQTALDKKIIGNISASSAYDNLIKTYNTASLNGILFDKITTNTLSEHVTRKALDGLFIKVADEEKAIRHDPIARVTDILKKVFGSKN